MLDEPGLRRINAYLMRWLRKKYKRLAPAKKARACWERITAQYPRLFAHWARGPAAVEDYGPGSYGSGQRGLWP